MSFVARLARSPRFLFFVWVLAGAVFGAVSLALDQSRNLVVFRDAARDLLAHRDLYAGTSVDWFKYSPTFALLFVPFAVAPAWLAAVVWGALNTGVAAAGLASVMPDDRTRSTALCWALPGVLLAMDGDQANLLVGGLLLLALAAYERGRSWHAAAAIVLATAVKIFPVVGALFALLFPDRERSLSRLLVTSLVALVLPLAVLSPPELAAEYASWGRLLAADHANRGWSLVTVARDLGAHALDAQIAGALLLVVPVLAAVAAADAEARRLVAASVLAFVVLFNHRAESTSFVLPALAAGIWLATSGKPTKGRIALVLLAAIAPGPFFALPEPSMPGVLGFFGAHRQFHALRIVPLALLFAQVLAAIVRRALATTRSVRSAA